MQILLFCLLCVEVLCKEEDSIWLKPEEDNLEDVCITEECITSASRILNNLDLSVDPCQDFYQFSCGGYAEKTLADDYKIFHGDSELEEAMKAQLKKLMQRPKSAFTSAAYKLKDFYDSCTNVAFLKELGVKPLNDFLNHYGGWPVVVGSKWDKNKFDWKRVVSEMIGDALPVNLFKFSLEFNLGHLNSDLHMIPVISVPESQPLPLRNKSMETNTHFNLLVEIAVLLGANKERAQEEMEDVYSFRTAMNEVLDSDVEELSHDICTSRRNADKPNSTTVDEFYTITNKIEWLSFLRRAFSSELTMDSEIICVGSDEVFARLIDVYDNTSQRVLANYLFSGLAGAYVHYIKSDQWDEIKMNALGVHSLQQPMSRWRICTPLAHNYFLPVLTSIFVQHNHKFKDKKNVEKMFLLIQKEFRKLLNSAAWLKNETLQKGKERIDDLTAFLVYADEILDEKLLEDYYRDVSISPYEFLNNIWQMNKFQQFRKSEYIDKPVVRNHWDHQISLLMSNAFYKPFYNTIDIPVSQTREHYFTMNRPHALNYGSLGAIIGHEILHAVNQIGVPKRPDIPTIKWWTEDDVIAFQNRAACTVNQYNKYGLPRRGKLNGTRTLDENIADNTGVIISYRAYQAWLNQNGSNDKRLPGLRFSPNQLFWISYANSWCYSQSFSRSGQRLSRRTHSVPIFRVWGSVSNSAEFAKDFDCPSNSRMNPDVKCSVW